MSIAEILGEIHKAGFTKPSPIQVIILSSVLVLL